MILLTYILDVVRGETEEGYWPTTTMRGGRREEGGGRRDMVVILGRGLLE